MKNLLFIVTLTMVFSILTFNMVYAEFLTNGLVSYWTFDKIDIIDKTAEDVWGQNNATIHGDPKTATGIVGEALKFDGINDYINLTTLGDFGKQSGKSTFEAWIKTTNKTDWMTLLDTNGQKCLYWSIQLNGFKSKEELANAPTMIFFTNSLKSVDGKHCPRGAIGTTASIFDGKWHHIVYTQDFAINPDGGRGKENGFIDSVLIPKAVTSFPDIFNFFSFTDPVYLGARQNDNKPQSFFKGYIDEVRIYNRPLTEDQVRQNFESRTPFNVDPKGKLSILWSKLKQ